MFKILTRKQKMLITIEKFILRIVYGEYALSGFCEKNVNVQNSNKKSTKYILASVFPDKSTADEVINIINQKAV